MLPFILVSAGVWRNVGVRPALVEVAAKAAFVVSVQPTRNALPKRLCFSGARLSTRGRCQQDKTDFVGCMTPSRVKCASEVLATRCRSTFQNLQDLEISSSGPVGRRLPSRVPPLTTVEASPLNLAGGVRSGHDLMCLDAFKNDPVPCRCPPSFPCTRMPFHNSSSDLFIRRLGPSSRRISTPAVLFDGISSVVTSCVRPPDRQIKIQQGS